MACNSLSHPQNQEVLNHSEKHNKHVLGKMNFAAVFLEFLLQVPCKK